MVVAQPALTHNFPTTCDNPMREAMLRAYVQRVQAERAVERGEATPLPVQEQVTQPERVLRDPFPSVRMPVATDTGEPSISEVEPSACA